MRNLFLATAALALAACQNNSGPATREAQLGIVCEGNMSLTGNFTMSVPQPVDEPGCWPVGTWAFTATVTSNACAPSQTPQLEQSYQFTVTVDEDRNVSYSYLNNPNDTGVTLRAQAAGTASGGLCSAQLSYFTPDGKTLINLRPQMMSDYSLSGTGVFTLYNDDMRDFAPAGS